MANNVKIPATGSGDATPIVSADQVSADSSQVQNVQQVSVSGGVITRNPVVPISATSLPLPATAATAAGVAAVNTTLGSPMQQSGGSLTANLGTLNGAATAAGVATVNTTLGTPMQQTGGSLTANLGTLNGAATAAKQPALGTAGAASTDVITIQGIASGVAIPVTGGGTPTDQQQTTTFSTVTNSTPITGLNGISTVVVEVLTTGNTATGVVWGVQGSQDGTNWEFLPWSVASSTFNTPLTGATNLTGTYYFFAAGWAQVRISVAAIASGNFPTNLRTTTGVYPARSVTAVITGALPAGTNAIGSLTAGSALIGKVGIDQTTPGTTNLVATELATGLTPFSNTALSSTKTAVKAGAGRVHGWMIHNPSAATTFIQVWNVAIGSITVGTTAPTYVITIPAGASANVFSEKGIVHSTEINIAATTTASGSSAPATAAVVSMFYV